MSKRAIIRGAVSLAVAAFVVVGLSGTLRADPVFTITDLGTMGGTESRAYGVNEAGQVTGYSRLADGKRHAFLWTDTNGDGQVNGDEMQDLGTLGGDESCGHDINEAGQVAGWSDRVAGITERHRGFLWTDINSNGQANPGEMANLNHLGGYKSRAYGMNNAGQVAGFAMDGNDDKCTFRWTDTDGDWQDDYPNEMKNLEWLPNGDSACGYGVNTVGHVVGYSNTTGGATRAFRWIDANGNGEADPGEMENLGTLGGASQAWDINDYGEIAGYYTTLAGKDHAFCYDTDGMVDLGTLPGGDESQAFGINYEEGNICGWSTVAGGDTHAFVYVFDDDGDDEMIDLNDLLPAGSGWVLRCARDIGEHSVVGWGVINGETHGFIMTEVVPEPATMLLVGTGILSLVGAIRRRRLH